MLEYMNGDNVSIRAVKRKLILAGASTKRQLPYRLSRRGRV